MKKKAILFDCFGVLATGTWQRFLDQLPTDSDVDVLHDINRAHDAGIIPDEEYLRRIQEITGYVPQRIEDVKSSQIGKNHTLLEYIRTLHRSYKTGILSNIGSDWITTQLLDSDEKKLFDDIVESFRFGMAKPDPALFTLAAERLGVQTNQCVFVDDSLDNVRGAESVGMQGVVYHSLTKLKKDLRHLLNEQ